MSQSAVPARSVLLISFLAVGLFAPAAVATGPTSDSPTPLCIPPLEVELPYTGTYPGPGSSSGGPTMKYGASPRPDAEAEYLAFTMRGSLLASDADYDRVQADLAAIRQQYVDMQEIQYTGHYAEGELLVSLITPDNPLISTETYDETNRFLKLCSENRFASFDGFDVASLHFPARINIPVLSERYVFQLMPNLLGVSSPNTISGLEDYIYVTDPTPARSRALAAADTTLVYEFEDGWYDCIDGCECKQVHTFETDEHHNVTFISSIFYFEPGYEAICIATGGDN